MYTYILDETRYVTTRVTSLRDWSNTTAMVERLHPEPIPVDTLMRDIRARFVPTANTKGIELEMRIADQPLPETGALPDAPIVLADPDAVIATAKTATAQAVSDGPLAQDRADQLISQIRFRRIIRESSSSRRLTLGFFVQIISCRSTNSRELRLNLKLRPTAIKS